MNWEYMVLEVPIGFVDELQVRLCALGSLGWEAVGYACIVQLGPNDKSVLLKREAPALARPADQAPGWRLDPAGRFEQRHWDGMRWTEHVTTAGSTTTDWPNVR